MTEELYGKIKNKNNYIIDIGAGGELEVSPVGSLISSDKYRGLCFEPHPLKYPVLRKRISHTFDLCKDFVTPNTVLRLFDKYSVPLDPDILKIDIDGYDLEVLREVTMNYRPKIIIAEINEKIPPPIHFEVLFRDTYQWDESHHFGFSIASAYKFARERNYKLLKITEGNNIILVDNNYLPADEDHNKSVHEIYSEGYVNSPIRKEFYYNADVDHWLKMEDPEELLGDIINYFETNNCRSKFQQKTKREGLDFRAGFN